MMLKHNRIWKFSPAVFTVALACSLSAQSSQEPGTPSEYAGEDLAGIRSSANSLEAVSPLDNARSRLRNTSSLFRVRTIEAIDGSVTIDADAANSILQSALQDKDPLVGEAALRALLHRGDEQQLRLVSEIDLAKYPGETSDLARVHVSALNQDLSSLRELMRNGDAVVQEGAFEALAAHDADDAVQALREEFLDPTSLYRLQTLELFARSPYGNSSATLLPILEAASRDEDPLVRDRAKELLAEQAAGTTSGQ